MGSSISTSQAILLAVAFGLLFLVFDAARSLALQLGPMWLRRLTADRPRGRFAIFHYTPTTFSLMTGTLVQITLVLCAVFTAAAVTEEGSLYALFVSALVWIFVIVAWKLVLAAIPDDLAEIGVRAILPVSRFFYILFWPLLAPIQWVSDRMEDRREDDVEEEEVTDAEVQAYIDVGEEEGILEEGEGKLIQSIVDFGDRLAREVMTPRIDMLALDVSRSLEDLAQVFVESKYSRIPVYEESIDRIVGIVHVKDVFEAYLRKESRTVRELARPAYLVSETKKVDDLLREFQIERIQLAIVLDEYGGTAGLVTIEDLLEEIVGEIADEHEDEEESVVELPGDAYLVNGLFRVDRLEELTGAELQGEDYETVAGLIFTHMGHVPKAGESIEKNGLLFEVERADRKRIYRVRVSRAAAPVVDEERG